MADLFIHVFFNGLKHRIYWLQAKQNVKRENRHWMMYFIGLKCDRFEINLPLPATVHATAFAKSIDGGAKGHDALCVAKLTASLSFCVSMSFFSACRLSMPSLLALQVNSHFPVYTTLLFILLSLAFLSCYWLTGCSIIFLNLSQRFQLEYIFHIYKTFHWRISFCSLCFFICFILLPLFFCCASSWVPSVMSFAFVRRALLYIQFIWLERLNPKAAHNIKLNYIFSFASLFLSFIAAFSSFLLFFDFIIFSVKKRDVISTLHFIFLFRNSSNSLWKLFFCYRCYVFNNLVARWDTQ